MDKKIYLKMKDIKKFNELYGGEEMDRGDWKEAPEVVPVKKTDKQKIDMIRDLYLDLEEGKMSLEEFSKGVKNILDISSRNFPGSTKL